MIDLYFAIGLIYLVLAILGFLFAYIIYLRPWEKTWLEVVAGVAGKDLAESALIGVTLWFFDLLWLWPMMLYPWSCSAVSGLSQIYWQERKLREGRKRAKWTIDKYNSKPTNGEDE